MALSDHPERKKNVVKRRPVVAETNKHWGDAQKLEAVQFYLMCGSVKGTAAALRIPKPTLVMWRASAWWKDLEAELKLQDELQLSARLKKIAEKSFAVVEDRLEHGNFIFDQKTGEVRRLPVSLKDAHKVALDVVQQREHISTRQVEKANDGQIMQKLEQLAESFAAMASDKFNRLKDEERTIEMVEEVTDIEGENNDLSGDSLSRDAGREKDKEILSNMSE